MESWEKPKITDITIECDEDVLADCWSASATNPWAPCCGYLIDCPGT
ncbi:MAG TPA: hypothetical protein VM283_05005 [Armatimonadota bacterium]|nr:hypothetical protein [Armatimonadota bacterium]